MTQDMKHLYKKVSFLLLLMIFSAGVNNVWGQKYADGVYYIRNNTNNKAYLWPSVITKDGKRYLTTLYTTEANSTQGCGNEYDKTYCHWVVKNIDNTRFQLINPRYGKYVVIRNKAFGDRDVWLDDLPTNLVQTYFTLNGDNAPYFLSPTDCFQTNTDCNLERRTLNSAQGGDKNGLGSGSSGTANNDQRQGLLQFYTGDPKWSFIEDNLTAPTISDVYDDYKINFFGISAGDSYR